MKASTSATGASVKHSTPLGNDNLSGIPKQRLKDIYEIFSVLDRDKDGSISLQEIGDLLKTLRLDNSDRSKNIKVPTTTDSDPDHDRIEPATNPNEEFVERELSKDPGAVPDSLTKALMTGPGQVEDLLAGQGATSVQRPTNSLEQKIMALADIDRNGSIDFEEFAVLADRELPRDHNVRASFSRGPGRARRRGSSEGSSMKEPKSGRSSGQLRTRMSQSVRLRPKARPKEREDGEAEAEREYVDLLKSVFNAFDADGDGYVDRNEIRHVLSALGMSVTEAGLEGMIARADSDGNSRIDFEEFVRMNRERDERARITGSGPDNSGGSDIGKPGISGLISRARRFFDCRRFLTAIQHGDHQDGGRQG